MPIRIRAAAAVLGFRTTSYVTSELIDWSAVPGDPIYRLVFPSEQLLPAAEVTRIADLLRGQAPRARIAAAARQARARLAGAAPSRAQDTPPGTCRASGDTVTVFPAPRHTARPYGISCFDPAPPARRPGQALTPGGMAELASWLTDRPQVTSVQFAGDDPLAMPAPALSAYLGPLLRAEQIESIQIGTTALAYWP